MIASDVPTATRIGKCNKSTRAGIIKKPPSETIKLQSDRLFFITEDCFFGHKSRKSQATSGSISKRANKLHFADLKPGDKVVHIEHGVGIFDGLKEIQIQGFPTELIQLSYKDNDKLYVPVYRIH